MSANTNMYTFTTAQAQKFASAEGVSVRVVRYGTEVMFYVDGVFAYKADLSKLNALVTDDREMKVSIKDCHNRRNYSVAFGSSWYSSVSHTEKDICSAK